MTINPLLSGLRVLDLSRLLPGPYCTMLLAQLGAEIVKVEEPKGGDYARTLSPEMFALVNRGKQSVTLDLRRPEGAAAFRELATSADVVLESFRPGVMDKLGCGYETLKAVNPKLVYAALTGYGQDGPYRDRAGHDMNYCGYAGALDQIGTAGGAPALGNTQIADLAGGALTCAVGILAAVLGARASGRGAFVDSAMLDGTLALQVVALSTLRTVGRSMPRGADMLTGGLPNYSLYECADGLWVTLGSLEPKFFAAVCAAAGRPDLLKLPMAPGPAGEPLRRELTALFKSRPRAEWLQVLEGDETCLGPVLTPAEALQDPQVRARGMARPDEKGKPLLGCGLAFQDARATATGPAPALGADTERVLAAAGLAPGAIAALRQNGAC